MEKEKTQGKLYGIFYDNGEVGKHQEKSIGDEYFEEIHLAQEFLSQKGYFQLTDANPHHFAKDAPNDFGFAIIMEL